MPRAGWGLYAGSGHHVQQGVVEEVKPFAFMHDISPATVLAAKVHLGPLSSTTPQQN